MDIQATITQKDCHKIIFNDLCDWTNWTGDRAMWIDECENEGSPETWQLSEFEIG